MTNCKSVYPIAVLGQQVVTLLIIGVQVLDRFSSVPFVILLSELGGFAYIDPIGFLAADYNRIFSMHCLIFTSHCLGSPTERAGCETLS